MTHIAVLKNEVIKYLDPKPNENFIDCTIDGGGHTNAILEKNKPAGKVLGIEIDSELYKKCLNSEFKHERRLVLVNDNFVHLKKIVQKKKFKNVSGILFDLGMSTWHMKESDRGFTFLKDEPLDMRYNCKGQRAKDKEQRVVLTAEEIINKWSEKEIEKILKQYGEEKFSKKISQEIIKTRKWAPLKTTFQLVEIIKHATPPWYHHKKIPRKNSFGIPRGRHPATKTFQALRIAVNDELNNLRKVLPQALEILMPGGRIVIISFHSLEDRIVKNFFREETKQNQIKIWTKKPIRPSKEEIKLNPSARSARLRAGVKK